ncbi:unnamed protein product [Alternaria alternata]
MSSSWSDPAPPRRPNYKVRFRHGVFPDLESQATRADIKKYDYFFGAGQKWVGTPANYDFVDESSLVAEEFENPGSADRRRAPKHMARSRSAKKIPQLETRKAPRASDQRTRPTSGAWSGRSLVPAAPQSIHSSWQLPLHVWRHTSPAPGSVSSLSSLDESLLETWHSDLPSPNPNIAASQSSLVAWPITDPTEAYLFRYWVDKAAESLDITSSTSIFKKVVPKLALTSSMLMNAIFMISGQCILRFDPYFPTKPYEYHERILQSLIPHLAEKGRIEDEATLVAAMLLRNFEDFHSGTQGQTHLSTFELFYGPEGWVFDMASPVVQAALVLHVHAEVSQALLNQPSLRIDYESFILPALASPIDEASWSNRILWLSARILQWAQKGMRTMDNWLYLHSLVDEWERRRPASFDAFFYQEENLHAAGTPPQLWFSSACHAAYTIHKFGTVLQDEQVRCEMIEFLEEVQATGMPAGASIKHLKEQWNWSWNHYGIGMNQL